MRTEGVERLFEGSGTGGGGLPVRVIRSAKRRKTCQARIVDGVIEVRVPARLSAAEEAEHVASLVAKVERQRSAGAIDLEERAHQLAARYDLPVPESVRWVDNQNSRWGSCTTEHGAQQGRIRLSNRMVDFPDWVIDAVLIHEMAHQIEMNHGPAFQALIDRYPLNERATGFLIAMEQAR